MAPAQSYPCDPWGDDHEPLGNYPMVVTSLFGDIVTVRHGETIASMRDRLQAQGLPRPPAPRERRGCVRSGAWRSW